MWNADLRNYLRFLIAIFGWVVALIFWLLNNPPPAL